MSFPAPCIALCTHRLALNPPVPLLRIIDSSCISGNLGFKRLKNPPNVAELKSTSLDRRVSVLRRRDTRVLHEDTVRRWLSASQEDSFHKKPTQPDLDPGLSVSRTEPDVKKLEDRLQGGQIEEVILQAENELSLARKMIQWKPWEPLVDEPPANQWKWPI
ncbi:NADH dehydrogenase [ubiquinone] 1 alpha subcomplex subunit 5 [Myotis lucifugus]|uniref:NADH dehydrogenase [ubiquinone] 1 alpha subcomplex subunit 5 n=1 Tax=Myotis lucifugus TaxID=59463 RepID=UPI000CCC01CD|nr:NADH dehydrogenase [ubiquinone] 1 alpha subcomplex subunit 5 [Myotis lucifugus]